MKVLLLLILHYGVTSLDAEVIKMCAPAEERTTYSFLIKWFPPLFDKTDLAILKGEIVMATCNTDLQCEDQFDHYTLTNVAETSHGMLVTNLTIVNVTRRDQALWSTAHVKGTRLLKSTEMLCYLQTFVKPEDVQCTSQIDIDHLHIICSTKKVYPEGKCRFTIKSAGETLSPPETIKYDYNTSVNEKVSYFQTTCRLSLKLTQLPTDDFSVTVSMYPDLKNEAQDMVYGSTYLLHYVRDSVNGCQRKLSNGQIVLCSTNTMQVTVDDIPAYVDKSSAKFEFTTPVTTVTKNYPEEALDGKCNLETYNDLVTIQCEVNHHMFQQVNCQLLIKKQGYTLFKEEVKPYKTIIAANNNNIYQSHCTFDVLRTNVHSIDATVVVTLIATDYNLNNEQNISLLIEPKSNMLLESDSLGSTNIHKVVFSLVICFVLVTTLVLVFCIARKPFRNCFKKNVQLEIQEEDLTLYAEIIDDTTRPSSGDRPHYINIV